MHFVYESVRSVINNLKTTDNVRLEGDAPSLTIIVPVLNEVERLPFLLEELAQVQVDQTIIVDGGSTDGSLQWLDKHFISGETESHILIHSDAGRAKQMNAGARQATSDVLLFLHADTVLSKEIKQEVQKAIMKDHRWGRFNISFDDPSFMMNIIAFFMNVRSKLSQVATGDQAMFIDRSLFEEVSGFDDIALMEDVAMSKKLVKLAYAPYSSSHRVITSARRWKKNGVLRTVVKMWWYRLAYYLGVSPDFLAQGYRNIR